MRGYALFEKSCAKTFIQKKDLYKSFFKFIAKVFARLFSKSRASFASPRPLFQFSECGVDFLDLRDCSRFVTCEH